jgi:hypothetical protein
MWVRRTVWPEAIELSRKGEQVLTEIEAAQERWGSIARALARLIKQAGKLPDYEQSRRFNELLEEAHWYAEGREEALINP